MIKSVKIIDVHQKDVKYDGKKGIYLNGHDNAYPDLTDRLINNSVTAKTCSNIMLQFLIGRGFGDSDTSIVNKESGKTLIEFAKELGIDIVNHRGFFIHVNYTVDSKGVFHKINPSVIPFSFGRVGEKDDKEYNGKILISSDFEDKKKAVKVYDTYNNKQSVIRAQVEKAGGIKEYKGQVLYYNADHKYYYPLSRIESVMDDCDSEYQSSIYKNRILRKGFFGKTIIKTRPLIDSNIEEFITNKEGRQVSNPEYISEESETAEFINTIEEFVGAENAGGAMVVEVDYEGDNIDDAMKVENIKSELQPALFDSVEKSTRENILIAFNNLPIGLVKASDGLFSSSAEAIVEMKNTYWENTFNERTLLENTLSEIISDKDKEISFKARPLVEEPTIDELASKEIAKAQAELRGSVGGATIALSIQQSVAEGKTAPESAISMLVNMFGYNEETASAMVGTKQKITNND